MQLARGGRGASPAVNGNGKAVFNGNGNGKAAAAVVAGANGNGKPAVAEGAVSKVRELMNVLGRK